MACATGDTWHVLQATHDACYRRHMYIYYDIYLYRAVQMLTQHDGTELEGELNQVFKMFCDNQTKLLALKGDICIARQQWAIGWVL